MDRDKTRQVSGVYRVSVSTALAEGTERDMESLK